MNSNNQQQPPKPSDNNNNNVIESESNQVPRLFLFQECLEKFIYNNNNNNHDFSRYVSCKTSRSNSCSSITKYESINAFEQLNIYQMISSTPALQNNSNYNYSLKNQNSNQIETHKIQNPSQKNQRQHICTLSQSNQQRCCICNANLKFFFHCNVDQEIERPWDISYADFSSIFAKKMYMQDQCALLNSSDHQYIYKNSRKKVFLQFNDFISLKEWVHYVSDRGYGFGLEELISKDKNKAPSVLLEHYLPHLHQMAVNNAASATTGTATFMIQQQISGTSSALLNSDLLIQSQTNILEDNNKNNSNNNNGNNDQPPNNNNNNNFVNQDLIQISNNIKQSAAVSQQIQMEDDQQNNGNSNSDNNNNQNNMNQNNNNMARSMANNNTTEDEENASCHKFSVLGDFEGSNIHSCQINRKGDKCNLLIKSDTNTKGCTHWFMFAVLAKEPCTVTFTVLNNKRKGDLYKEGMQIAIYNSLAPQRGWHRGGENIFYYKSNVDHMFYRTWKDEVGATSSSATTSQQQNGGNSKKKLNRYFHSLDFTYTFQEAQQRVVFAYCYPYTQSDLNNFLEKEEELLKKNCITNSSANIVTQAATIQQLQQQQNVEENNNNSNIEISQTIREKQNNLAAPSSTIQNNNSNNKLKSQSPRYQQQQIYQNNANDNNNNNNSTDSFKVLMNQGKNTLKIKTPQIYYKKKVLAASRLGLPILYLKITSNRQKRSRCDTQEQQQQSQKNDQQPYQQKQQHKRKVIYVLARQHAGETPGSYVCSGLISFLLSDSIQSRFLRELYIFKIFPMLNPDGVVVGNARASLSGHDLNRRWQNPDPVLNPEIYHTKAHILKTLKRREIMLLIDLHGHSQKKHTFMYGCNKTLLGGCGDEFQQIQSQFQQQQSGQISYNATHSRHQARLAAAVEWIRVRLFPRIMAKKSPNFFNLQDCRFKVTEDRVSTARVVSWLEFGIQNAYTLETSFFGYSDSSNEGKATHFTVEDLESIGKSLGVSMVDFSIICQKLISEKSGEMMQGGPTMTKHIQPTQLTQQHKEQLLHQPHIQIAQQQQNSNSINFVSSSSNNNNANNASTSFVQREQKIFSFSACSSGVYQIGNGQTTTNNGAVNNVSGGVTGQIAQQGGAVQQQQQLDITQLLYGDNQNNAQNLNKLQKTPNKAQDKLRKSITPFRINKSKRKKAVNGSNFNNDLHQGDISPLNSNNINQFSVISCGQKETGGGDNVNLSQIEKTFTVNKQDINKKYQQQQQSHQFQHSGNNLILAKQQVKKGGVQNNIEISSSPQQQFFQQLSPTIMSDWRDYFTREELEQNFKIIEQGGDPNDYESDTGSDSQPEIDLYQDGDFPYQKEKKQIVMEIEEDDNCNNENDEEGQATTGTQNRNNKKNGKQKNGNNNNNTNKQVNSTSNTNNKNILNNNNSSSLCKKQLSTHQNLQQKKNKKQSYPLAKVGQTFYDWNQKKEQFQRLHKLEHNQQQIPICQLQQQSPIMNQSSANVNSQNQSSSQQQQQRQNENASNRQSQNNSNLNSKSPNKLKQGHGQINEDEQENNNNINDGNFLNQSIKNETINNSVNYSRLMNVDEEPDYYGNQNILQNQEGQISLFLKQQQQQQYNSQQQQDIGQIIQQKLKEGNNKYIPISQIYSNKMFKKQKIYDTIIQQQLALSLNNQPINKPNLTASNYFSIQKTETDFVIKKINVLPKYQINQKQIQKEMIALRANQQLQQQFNSNNTSLNNSKLVRQNSLLQKRNNSQDSIEFAIYNNNNNNSQIIQQQQYQLNQQIQQQCGSSNMPSPYLQQNENQQKVSQQENCIQNEVAQNNTQIETLNFNQQQLPVWHSQQINNNYYVAQQQQQGQKQPYQQMVIIQPNQQTYQQQQQINNNSNSNHIQLEPLKLQLNVHQLLNDNSNNNNQAEKTGNHVLYQKGPTKTTFYSQEDKNNLIELQKQLNSQAQQNTGIQSSNNKDKGSAIALEKQRLFTHSSGRTNNNNNSYGLNQITTSTTANSANIEGTSNSHSCNKSNNILGNSVDDGIFKLRLYKQQKNQSNFNQDSLLIKNFNFNNNNNYSNNKYKKIQNQQQQQSPDKISNNISSLIAKNGGIISSQKREELVSSNCSNRQIATNGNNKNQLYKDAQQNLKMSPDFADQFFKIFKNNKNIYQEDIDFKKSVLFKELLYNQVQNADIQINVKNQRGSAQGKNSN